jgi:hypothetical protein
MPAPSKRPAPPARMVTLLATEKQRLLAANGHVTRQDFEEAWRVCWEVMVLERAWAHQTPSRRNSRACLVATKSEVRAAFLDQPTAFSTVIARLSDAACGMCLQLAPGQTVEAMLAAISYVEDEDELQVAA